MSLQEQTMPITEPKPDGTYTKLYWIIVGCTCTIP